MYSEDALKQRKDSLTPDLEHTYF
ncbi:MAG: hypothetical protein JWN98_1269, partial [Abditibacteriota bacterium]|nr:hypothetical protein [Abditibacteriota bacterium]